eukprot:gnl/TRDRNA2_/TRDRNA2_175756_c5_seq17.p1 gnl/TRDRNA2_/TRDRNA2_175756_c5~~gnl/TRDRNA2_/TRDRNA2_175756_c5_seq17.p1  ORF type:complete len:465 (+),score=28.16 gnl/TRDRNA2_/TRDRNA2_175756_c5_seq17:174-1568(+)
MNAQDEANQFHRVSGPCRPSPAYVRLAEIMGASADQQVASGSRPMSAEDAQVSGRSNSSSHWPPWGTPGDRPVRVSVQRSPQYVAVYASSYWPPWGDPGADPDPKHPSAADESRPVRPRPTSRRVPKAIRLLPEDKDSRGEGLEKDARRSSRVPTASSGTTPRARTASPMRSTKEAAAVSTPFSQAAGKPAGGSPRLLPEGMRDRRQKDERFSKLAKSLRLEAEWLCDRSWSPSPRPSRARTISPMRSTRDTAVSPTPSPRAAGVPAYGRQAQSPRPWPLSLRKSDAPFQSPPPSPTESPAPSPRPAQRARVISPAPSDELSRRSVSPDLSRRPSAASPAPSPKQSPRARIASPVLSPRPAQVRSSSPLRSPSRDDLTSAMLPLGSPLTPLAAACEADEDRSARDRKAQTSWKRTRSKSIEWTRGVPVPIPVHAKECGYRWHAGAGRPAVSPRSACPAGLKPWR